MCAKFLTLHTASEGDEKRGPTQGPKHKNIERILCIVKNIQNAKPADIKAKSDMVTRGKQAKSELQNRVWGGDPVLGGFDSYTLPP